MAPPWNSPASRMSDQQRSGGSHVCHTDTGLFQRSKVDRACRQDLRIAFRNLRFRYGDNRRGASLLLGVHPCSPIRRVTMRPETFSSLVNTDLPSTFLSVEFLCTTLFPRLLNVPIVAMHPTSTRTLPATGLPWTRIRNIVQRCFTLPIRFLILEPAIGSSLVLISTG
jgi:hypothetical protein